MRWLLLAMTWLCAAQALAEPSDASFALIIGVNRSVDPHAPLLRYADDDAARYVELFRTLGARSYVLSRLDENTIRLHPQVAAEAQPPRAAEYRQVIEQLAGDIAQARARGIKTSLYFVYAGHGDVENGRGYITLEDERLYGEALESELLARIKPDREHFIVDACHSYFLAVGRGPGGTRRDLRGFSQLVGLVARPSTGLLFSTSSAKESHEWAGFEAGIFSHEVRSGLYGAADADGDGRVSYKEIAAFIQRANASVLNERYRPEVYAKPPEDSDLLLDISPKLGTRIDTMGMSSDHYLLEDERGVRFADFHTDGSSQGYLIRPRAEGRLYLRRLRDEREVVIPLVPAVVTAARLPPEEARIASRGAAHDAFESLFALPFSPDVVQSFRFPRYDPGARDDTLASAPSSMHWRALAGFGLIGAGALSAGLGVAGVVQARKAHEQYRDEAQESSINERIRAGNRRAAVGFTAAGVGIAAGILVLLWPRAERMQIAIDPGRRQAMVGVRESF